MKVVRGDGLFGHVERLETGGPHSENAVDVLHFTVDDQVRVIKDSGALAIEDVRHDDGVRNASLIFQTEKQESFGSAGTLAADNTAGDPNLASVVDEFQLSGGCDPERAQLFAMKSHGVFADGEVRSTEIGVQALAGAHGLKGV